MRRLFYASLTYMVAGVFSGFFYREFTKANNRPEGQFVLLGRAINRDRSAAVTIPA